MFKSVEYVGFEDKPELEAKARELTSILANEIRRWREDVVVRWSPHNDNDSASGVLDLTLSLTMPNGVTGVFTGTFLREDLGEEWLKRIKCRQIWDDLLGVLLDKQHKRVEESFLETAEA